MKENSIEEAIERLEYIDRAYSCNNYFSTWDLKCIEILLSDYKRVLKENEKLKAKIDICNWQEKSCREIIENKYISKQKIKDKIELLEEKAKYEQNTQVLVQLYKQIKVLKELLNESEENYGE